MNTLFNHQNFDNKGRRMSFAGVVNVEANTISIGLSTCSTKDQFSKHTGRAKAQGNALSQHPVAVIQIESEKPSHDFYNAIQVLAGKKEEVLTA